MKRRALALVQTEVYYSFLVQVFVIVEQDQDGPEPLVGLHELSFHYNPTDYEPTRVSMRPKMQKAVAMCERCKELFFQDERT